MKKITFILLALISGNTFAQNSANASSTVNAEIVLPISIVKGDQLNFGKIAAGTEAGAVRVHTDGTTTFSNPGMKVPTNTTVSPATFTISGASGVSFAIDIPSISLSGPGTEMALSFVHNLKEAGNLAGTDTGLIVGGLLQVNANQSAGAYEGTVVVTVSYE